MLKKSFLIIICTILLTAVSCSKNNQTAKNENNSESADIDLDLTKMSSAMIYSTVFNMVMDPELYNGKTINLAGYFMTLKDPYGNDSWTVIVPDATACCEQGLSFNWDFGENKPAEKTDITVKGNFTVTELENGLTYYFIEGTEVTVNSR